MSKNNLQESEAVQPVEVAPEAEVVKPAKKPNVVEIRPLHVIQPVEFFQTVNSTAVAYEEPVAEPVVEEAPVEEAPKANKKLRRSQGIWSVIAVVALVAVFVLFLGNVIKPFSVALKNPVGTWFIDGTVPGAEVYLFLVGYAVAALALSVLIRFIAGCFKKPTCGGCEFVKFCWTTIFVTIAAFFVFALLGVKPFPSILEGLLEAFGGADSVRHQFGIMVFGVCIALVVLVVIITIAHKAKDKKRTR